MNWKRSLRSWTQIGAKFSNFNPQNMPHDPWFTKFCPYLCSIPKAPFIFFGSKIFRQRPLPFIGLQQPKYSTEDAVFGIYGKLKTKNLPWDYILTSRKQISYVLRLQSLGGTKCPPQVITYVKKPKWNRVKSPQDQPLTPRGDHMVWPWPRVRLTVGKLFLGTF